MKRTLLSLIVTAALFFGLAGAHPALALEVVTLSAAGSSNESLCAWDPATGVATLQQDIAGLIIQPDIANIVPSVTVEGNEHSVTGSGASGSVGVNITSWISGTLTVNGLAVSGFAYGVLLNGSSGVTLEGISASGCTNGIYLNNSRDNTVSGCTADHNTPYGYGIYVSSGGNNTLANNHAASNSYNGIHIQYSNDNTLTGNELLSNGNYGLYIYSSSNNTLTDNSMTGNTYDFRVYGTSSSHYHHTVNTSNTVGGRPILYVVGVQDATTYAYDPSDPSTDAGTVYLVDCKNVTLTGVRPSGNYSGVYLWFTQNSTIENVQTAGNAVGIYMASGSNGNIVCNNIIGDEAAPNSLYGLYLSASSNNRVYGNQFLYNKTQASVPSGTGNSFNEPKPTGGNYWSNWTTPDSDNDGFVDYPYGFTGGQDLLPLANPPAGDHTPPVTTCELAGTLSPTGWYTTEVQVTLSATDDNTGVKYTEYSSDSQTWTTYQGPFGVSDEGQVTLYYRSIDNALNTEQAKSVSFKTDMTPPVLTQAAVDEDKWYNFDVTVPFSAADGVSGLADPADATFDLVASGEGAAVSTGTYTVYDVAGNSATAGPLTFKIDKTAPDTVGTPSEAPNAAGWYNTDVEIVWSATDAFSGVDPATVPDPSTITGEGTDLGTVAPSAVYDLVGNADAIASVSGIKIDRTPPTITITAPDVSDPSLPIGATLDFGASDALSGIAAVTGKLTSSSGTTNVASGDALPNEVGVYTLVVTATDVAGNVATETVEFVVYDPYNYGGFVTGGAWFTSAPGAYPADPTLTGKVSCSFVSKYDKKLAPNGEIELHFQNANIDFHSTAYDSLGIAGTKATFKGTGTVNGEGSYSFMIVAIDGTPDCIRIKITDNDTGATLYDTGQGADETSGPTTAIEGGNISVKKS